MLKMMYLVFLIKNLSQVFSLSDKSIEDNATLPNMFRSECVRTKEVGNSGVSNILS